MFTLQADKNKLVLQQREAVTSGSVNVYRAQFGFSQEWEALARTAVFRAGDISRSVLLDETGVCTIPWEVLAKPRVMLYAGVYGTLEDKIVLPTIWACLGAVLEGTSPGENARPPTQELWRQELEKKGDALDYTPAGELGLYAGRNLLSSVPIRGSGGGGGATDHRVLTHREAAEQHPMEAISGLCNALSRIPEPVEALSNEELEAILK